MLHSILNENQERLLVEGRHRLSDLRAAFDRSFQPYQPLQEGLVEPAEGALEAL